MTPDPFHAIFPVLTLLHPPVFTDDHRRDRLAALDSRDVEAFDATRDGGQTDGRAQRLERVEMRGSNLVELGAVRELGVARRELDERALVAAPWHDDADPPVGPC